MVERTVGLPLEGWLAGRCPLRPKGGSFESNRKKEKKRNRKAKAERTGTDL